jgi:hypothetical protein
MFETNEPSPLPVPAVTKGGISPELIAVSIARRPILLLGDVGVGKTTFIRYLINVEAAGIFKQAIALHLDLGSQAALAEDLRAFVLHEIENQLRELYGVDVYERNFVRGVYDLDLKRFQKGIYGELRESAPDQYRQKELAELERVTSNRQEHLRRSLEHIAKGRQKQVVVFLDNADQRDDLTQEAAFLIAQEMAQQWPALVFVSLRPETFNRSQRSGAISGYHAKAFTISPPRIDQVIIKRLRFALKLTQGEIRVRRLQNIALRLESLTTLVIVLLQSLERDDRLFEFLDNISGGNVRAALMMLTTFIGSGHVHTQKILDIVAEQGSYDVPPHEILRAVIYGDHIHYDPTDSVISNLFDISTPHGGEHFLLPLVIGVLERATGAAVKEGFVETSTVYESLQNMGFTPDQIDLAVGRAVDRQLVETSGRQVPRRGSELPSALRATATGLYHIHRLAGSFAYVDAMIVDTPILDNPVRQHIRVGRNIEERLATAEVFAAYLDSKWQALEKSAIGFDWAEASGELRGQIATIRIRRAIRQNNR